MRKARLWGLLWTSFFLELQGAPKIEEIKYTRTEGQSLNESCPFNVMMYINSRKAWQKLGDRGEFQTLAVAGQVSGMSSKVQEGRCFLEEIPTDGILHVHMADLRREDSGLYRCVIYQPPKAPVLLHQPIRLVVTKDPASDIGPTRNLAQKSTLPPVTTKAQGKTRPSPRSVTQLRPLSTAGLEVNPTRGTDVLNTVPRISVISIITIVMCGILSKSLVFTLLLIATQVVQPLGPRTQENALRPPSMSTWQL